MVKLVLTPDWFIGKDLMIEVFSLLVLVMIVSLAYKYYRLSRSRSMIYLGLGFGLLALAQVATIITKIPLYYNFSPTTEIGHAIVTSNLVSSVDFLYYIGFFFSMFFTLCGLYLIYRLPRSKKSVGDYLVGLYFILISSLLSQEIFYIYHLTLLFILVLTVEKYALVYKQTKFFNTKVLISAFTVLALSQLVFIVSHINVMFVAANVLELIGYSIFLALTIRILKHGKKKKPYGDNIRHAGNSTK